MKTLVLYDSKFGNTQKVAQHIGDALGEKSDVSVLHIDTIQPHQLGDVSLLVVGSPTHAFRPTPALQTFLKGIPAGGLKGVRTAAFDTRISPDDCDNRLLAIAMKLFGFAAKPIATLLQKKGGTAAGKPDGFYVNDKEGPLKAGELERAAVWARQLMQG